MAFPTSGLVDNQVHKEGNRSFVYDSTLLVWDQVPEAPETISILGVGKGLDDVTLGSSVVFPAGHVVQVIQTRVDGTIAIDSVGSYGSLGHSAAITPAAGNKVLVCLNVIAHYIDQDRQIHGQVWRDIAGGGYSAVFDAFRYELYTSAVVGGMSQMFLDFPNASGSQVVTYRVYGKVNSGSQQYHNGVGFPNTLTLMEIVA